MAYEVMGRAIKSERERRSINDVSEKEWIMKKVGINDENDIEFYADTPVASNRYL